MTTNTASQKIKVARSNASDSRRRLLATVDHCVSPRTIYSFDDALEEENVVPPLNVELSTFPKASLCVAVDLKNDAPSDYRYIYVVIRKMDSPTDMCLEIEASVQWFKRPSPNDKKYLGVTDKSKLPCEPEPLIKKTLTEAGDICELDWAYTRFIAVQLEVYAVDVPDAIPLLRGLEDLLATTSLSDVVLKTDDSQFPAHQVVLAANSVVFLKMFVGDFKEAKDGVVNIIGTTSVALRIMLEYMYTTVVLDWEGSEIEVMELADRYMVDGLKAICEARLLEMGPDTALGLLKQASKPIISSDVRMRAVKVVLQSWKSVFITPQWSDFQKECPVLADAIRAAQALYGSAPSSASRQ